MDGELEQSDTIASSASKLVSHSGGVIAAHFSGKKLGMQAGFEYQEFIYWITDEARYYRPDIVTVLEAGTSNGAYSASVVANLLTSRTGVSYFFRETNTPGGAAVVWRDRFNFVSSTSIPLYVNNGSGCVASNWTALAVKLIDTATNKYVTAVSAHFPTTGPCAWENMKVINNTLASLGGDIKIIGVDANKNDANRDSAGNFQSWDCWYKGAVGDLAHAGCDSSGNLNYKDVAYRACYQASPTGIPACLYSSHWTYNGTPKNRWDFIFTKGAYSIDTVTTLAFSTADIDNDQIYYSDHRGIHAKLNY